VQTLRGLTVVLLAAALGQLPPSASDAHCASHGEMLDATNAHGEMLDAGNAHGERLGATMAPDVMTTPMHDGSQPQAPCEHESSGDCSAMTSCATAAVESQATPVAPAIRPVDAIASTTSTPRSSTSAPDTPPPRR